jgi:hypothetical protein
VNGFTQIKDPSIAYMASNLQAISTLKAIAVGGTPLLVNALPGQLGTVPLTPLVGPGGKTIDVNLIKRIHVTERIVFQLGATAQNLTNTPVFANPSLANSNINSTNFGRITGMAAGSTPRIIVLQGRVIF